MEAYTDRITIENADKVKYILLNNYLEDKTIELEYKYIKDKINSDVITYLMKDELSKEKGNPSFLHLIGMNCVNLKIVI